VPARIREIRVKPDAPGNPAASDGS
jgi:hypothetical protein